MSYGLCGHLGWASMNRVTTLTAIWILVGVVAALLLAAWLAANVLHAQANDPVEILFVDAEFMEEFDLAPVNIPAAMSDGPTEILFVDAEFLEEFDLAPVNIPAAMSDGPTEILFVDAEFLEEFDLAPPSFIQELTPVPTPGSPTPIPVVAVGAESTPTPTPMTSSADTPVPTVVPGWTISVIHHWDASDSILTITGSGFVAHSLVSEVRIDPVSHDPYPPVYADQNGGFVFDVLFPALAVGTHLVSVTVGDQHAGHRIHRH